jgi:hypothetical protein
MTEDVTPRRRFPSPWHADPMPGGYVVRDANGQALAYLYSRLMAVSAQGHPSAALA